VLQYSNTTHVVRLSSSAVCVDRLMQWLCLFGSFVHVTLGRYHENLTGDKYNNYREIVRVCRTRV